jgi:eukaryotic-like serine/threonine-protein kinase
MSEIAAMKRFSFIGASFSSNVPALCDGTRARPFSPNILGHLLAVRGDHDAAVVAAYREALRIEPGHTGALTNLVTMLKNKGDQDGITAVLRAAIRARPDHAWSHEALSAALQARGDRDGAIAEIREALRLKPEEQAYRTQLNALLKSTKDSTMPSP